MDPVDTLKSQKRRYQVVAAEKSGGATYTPTTLANFVADQILLAADLSPDEISILDPAIGDGELLISLLSKLTKSAPRAIIVYGFDTDRQALNQANRRLSAAFPKVKLQLAQENFLDFVLKDSGCLEKIKFDIIIANPPYVRTQIMGSSYSQQLARAFGLKGRVDLYHGFLIGIAQVLKPNGTAGIIVSNRLMTTKGGASLRAVLRFRLRLRHIWDLGDTKIFAAAVLPAIILAKGQNGVDTEVPTFTSIYQTDQPSTLEADDPIAALSLSGTVTLRDGRRFFVQHGTLSAIDDIWRMATVATDEWLAAIARNTWKTFGDIGKIRVGVKTCADKVFIRSDWHIMPEDQRPEAELLRPLTTHFVAGRFRAFPREQQYSILYPHAIIDGKRQAVDLFIYPKALAYLETHGTQLRERTYVLAAGRCWYEIWVPQDPGAWKAPKLVFRDISQRPTFWLDLEGTIVNGDCYWLTPEHLHDQELLWLAAAVANSTFIEAFYDHCFNNKLYAGRRRFITQYVEKFPLPNPYTELAGEIVSIAKVIYAQTDRSTVRENQLDLLIWQAFGLSVGKTTM